MILLDTDICVELLRGNRKVRKKIEQAKDICAISFLTVGELYYGAYRASNPEEVILSVEKFLIAVPVIESNQQIMRKFGQLKAGLKKSNNLLPDADIFIAATAIESCGCLITGNTKYFARFKELQLENWIK